LQDTLQRSKDCPLRSRRSRHQQQKNVTRSAANGRTYCESHVYQAKCNVALPQKNSATWNFTPSRNRGSVVALCQRPIARKTGCATNVRQCAQFAAAKRRLNLQRTTTSLKEQPPKIKTVLQCRHWKSRMKSLQCPCVIADRIYCSKKDREKMILMNACDSTLS